MVAAVVDLRFERMVPTESFVTHWGIVMLRGEDHRII